MGVLAHVLEAAGIATVSLMSVLGQARKVRAPRALYCEFPLGRPLGIPGDAAFQHRVLGRAFALLDAPLATLPVLDTFDTVVRDESAAPLTCTVPPRHDPSLHPAVDEARGLRAAFERTRTRTGRSGFGKAITVEQVGDAVDAFVRIAAGTDWKSVGLPGNPPAVASDLRTYYEEAALSLADDPTAPGARAAQAWFVERTETGRVLQAAQAALKAGGAPHPVWYYVLPIGHR